jgi:hypothetical protein
MLKALSLGATRHRNEREGNIGKPDPPCRKDAEQALTVRTLAIGGMNPHLNEGLLGTVKFLKKGKWLIEVWDEYSGCSSH